LAITNEAFALKIAVTLDCPAITSLSCQQAALCDGIPCKSSSPDQHMLNCRNGGVHQIRHNLVRNEITEMLRDSGYAVKMEPRGTLRGGGKGSPDIEVFHYPVKGCHSLVEVAVVNPIQKNLPKKEDTINKALRAAKAREASKRSKYASIAARNARNNLQAVIETTGATGEGLNFLIENCANKVKEEDPATLGRPMTATWAAPSFECYWRQRIAIAVIEGNSIMATKITNRLERITISRGGGEDRGRRTNSNGRADGRNNSSSASSQSQ
jgi:hypothetical protein